MLAIGVHNRDVDHARGMSRRQASNGGSSIFGTIQRCVTARSGAKQNYGARLKIRSIDCY